jgi:uncharacterized membrane protein YdbT with pleckstrin-like domain
MEITSKEILWEQRKLNWCRTPFTFTKYFLTQDELIIKSGVFNEKFEKIKTFRIIDFKVKRSFIQRIFKLGTICISSSDTSAKYVELINIKDVFITQENIQKVVDKSRSDNGVIAREFVDGHDIDVDI